MQPTPILRGQVAGLLSQLIGHQVGGAPDAGKTLSIQPCKLVLMNALLAHASPAYNSSCLPPCREAV